MTLWPPLYLESSACFRCPLHLQLLFQCSERVLCSFEDLSGCVASDQMVGGFCKVGLGAISFSRPNTCWGILHHHGLTKRILVSVTFQRGH